MFRRFVTLLLPMMLSGTAFAQDTGSINDNQVMMILDGSNSMWGRVDGEPKISIAKRLMTDLITNWDSETEMGMMVYGHRRKGDCADIEVVAMPGKVNRARLIDKVQSISPRGKTPISKSLLLGAVSVGYFKGKNSLVLVSDGIETCEADPCAQARSLDSLNPDFEVHVIGFDVTEEEFKSLQCIATETGGKFFRANNADELQEALKKTVQAASEPLPAIAAKAPPSSPLPQAETDSPPPSQFLYAKLCETCDRENHDIKWIVRKEDRTLHDSLGVIYADADQLPAGTYDVEVQYHSSALTGKGQITIGEDGQQKDAFNLNGGSAQLYAFATDDKSVAATPILYRFFPIVDGTVQSSALAESAISNADTWLPAGHYKVIASHEGLTASSEIEVRPGETTKHSFDLRFGSIRPRVSIFEGGKITGGQMHFSLFETEEAAQKSTGNAGAVATALGEQNKFLSAKPGKYYLRISYQPGFGAASKVLPVTIDPGMRQDLPISLDAAPFTYQITKKSGGWSGFGLNMYKVDADGNRAAKVGFAIYSKSRGVVEPGLYMFAITSHGQTVNTQPFELRTGQINELNITIP